MTPSDKRLREGIAAYKQGRKEAAGRLFIQSLRLDPKNERAWLWLSGVVETDEQRRVCLKKVLALNPVNEAARLGLWKLREEEQERVRPSPPPQPVETPVKTRQVVNTVPAPEKAEKGQRRIWLLLSIGAVILLPLIFLFLLNFFVLPTFFSSDDGAELSSIQLSAEEESAVISAVYENIAAANAENIDRYMTSLHSQSQDYTATRETLESLYRDYDLTVILSGVEIVSYTPSEARVRYTQETRRRNGPNFRDNRITGEFILRPEDGQWKLYDQVVSGIEYLD